MANRIYLRPTGFVDAPFGYDGQVLRLAGGLCFFTRFELIEVCDGERVRQTLVSVEALDSHISSLPSEMAEQAKRVLGYLTSPRAPLKVA